jgi:putative ABC transport system permease protein
MRLPHGVRRAFRLLTPGGYRDEVDEELRFHLERRIEHLEASGMDPAEARREALRRFGDAGRVARECRSIARTVETGERRATVRDELLQDLGWALRQVRRQPALTVATVLILALGIGASTALFSVADAVVFRALPFEAPDRLVRIFETTPQGERFSVSLPNLLDWRRESEAVTELAGVDLRNASLEVPAGPAGEATGSPAEPRQIHSAPVTEGFFPLLRLRPAAGSLLPAEAFVPGGDADRVVLSHELWRRDFGSDPEVVGSTVMLDRRPHRVVGVLQPGAAFPEDADVWVPLVEEPRWDRSEKDFQVVARLAGGVSVGEAEADLDRVARSLGERYPEPNEAWGAEVVPLREALVGPEVDRALLVLLGAVGLLLLIACVNVSSLLVARGAARGREMAVRVSLGASRKRLVRQLLGESAAIGLLGGALGMLFAWVAIELVRLFGPEDVPRLAEAAIDARVLAFALAVALLSSLVFGLLPALQTSRGRSGGPARALRSGGAAGSGTSGSAARLRGALVVTQLALAVTLLIGAGLTARSYARLLQVDPGFDAADVLAVRVDLPEAEYGWDARPGVAERVRRRLEALPGVAHAGGSVGSPFAGFYTANSVAVPGREPDADGAYPMVQWRAVTPGYFEALDLPVLRGRGITEEDGSESDTLVISRAAAEMLWPGEDALGKALHFGRPDGDPRRIVGVVGDLRDVDLEEAPQPTVFLPYAQIPWVHQTWLVEVAAGAEPGSVAGAVREALRAELPGVPVPEVRPLASDLSGARTNPRFQALLMAAFALTAAALAAAGVYGLMAFSVARRRQEIGVRMALGARPGTVVGMIAREGARLVLAGAVLGTAGAVLLARALESLLYETPALEWSTYGVAVGVLVAAALLASWLPARRAAGVDPKRALAAE